VLAPRPGRRTYRCLFLPKFHPELNPIERVWSYTKWLLREDKVEKNARDFESSVVRALEAVPPEHIAGYFRSLLRYFWTYNFLGTTYDVATELTKAFKRHREAPSAAVQEKVDALLAAQQAAAGAADPPLPAPDSDEE
jgi:hypothetical protein